MCGTRDAVSNWERDWQGHLEKLGLRAGAQLKKLVPQQEKENLEFDTRRRLRGVRIKGESVGTQETVKARFGKEHQGAEPEKMLGETWTFYQHDPGLENGNTVQTPMFDDVKDENPVQWTQNKSANTDLTWPGACSSSQDKADITFAVNELCQKMSDPTQRSFAELKRLVRYLKGERQWIQVFKFGDMSSEVKVFSGSDWAGDKETRKLSSAGVLLVGRLFIQQNRKSSPEAVHKQSCM